MRLFFAAMLPADIQGELAKIRHVLQWIPVRGAWTAPENIHITIKFLGEVPDDQVMPVIEAARARVIARGAIRLQPHDIVMFPPAGSARVLGAGFQGDVDRLTEIQVSIEEACAELGYERENRRYVPHATLARFKDGLWPEHRPRVEADCSAALRLPPFTLEAIQLMQSRLSPRGSTYTAVASFPL